MFWLFALFLFTTDLAETTADCTRKKLIIGFDSGKNVNFQLIGDDFFTIPISKIMVLLEFPGFPLNVDKFGRILATYVCR